MVTVKAPKDKIMCGTGLALSAHQVFPNIEGTFPYSLETLPPSHTHTHTHTQVFPDVEGTFPYSLEETKSKIPQMLY